MARRTFLTSVAGTAAGGLMGSALPASASAIDRIAPDAPLLATTPMTWAPRADGAEFIWSVSRLARGRVEIRGAGAQVTAVATDPYGFVPQSAEIMRVRVDGLRPGATYEWRTVTEAIDGDEAQEVTGWRAFRTLDPGARETTFCIWNDTHENHETIRQLQAVTPGADFLLWNGDTCNDWHQEEWLAPTLLAPAGVDISAGHPILMTFGNHDVRGKFAFRVADHIATPEGRPFYAFRSGPVAIIALNTGEDKPDDHPSFQGRVAFQQLREEQAAWLAETIRRPEIADAPYRVLFCHLPLRWIEEPDTVDYAGGGFDRYARSSRDLWHDALVEWGVQLVLSGHTHSPASIAASAAFPYAQMIGGGPRQEQATWMEVHADPQRLSVIMKRLATGEVIHQERFSPLV